MISGGLMPIGYVLAGPLAASLGSVNVLIAGSVLSVIAFSLGLLPRETRSLERLAAVPPPLARDESLAASGHRY
jgi:hypothetical protein